MEDKKKQWVNDNACNFCEGRKHHTCTGYECKEAIEAAGDNFDRQNKTNGWKSADKPPKHSEDVLICYVNEDQEVAHYDGDRWWRGKFFTDMIDNDDVAAWRSLPEPYHSNSEGRTHS